MTGQPQKVPLRRLNLIGTDRWYDLLGETRLAGIHGDLELAPYGCAWITNYPRRDGCIARTSPPPRAALSTPHGRCAGRSP